MKIKSIFGLYLAGLIGLSASCSEMDETYNEYIKGGEIVYRSKPVHIDAFAGNLRANIEWSLLYPVQVEKCLIYSDNKLLAEVPVVYGDSVRLSYLLSDLEEKTYTLNIYSQDKQGNLSIKSELFVNIYGPRYSSSLRPIRSIKNLIRLDADQNQANVTLSYAEKGVSHSELVYLDTEQKEVKVLVDSKVNDVILENVPLNGTISIRDLILPDTTCIDTFPAPAVSAKIEELPCKDSRTIVSIYKKSASTVYLSVTGASEGTLKTVITYSGTDGTDQMVELSADDNTIDLTGVGNSGFVRIQTVVEKDGKLYITPEVTQTIASIHTLAGKAAWHWTDISDYQYGDGAPEKIYDGEISAGSIWHTPYNDNAYFNESHPDSDYPHWIVVNMEESMQVASFGVARRTGNNNFPSSIRFEVSEDGINWHGEEFSTNINTDAMQYFNLTTPIQGKFFKFTGLKSGTSNSYMCMSEISVLYLR